MLITVPLVITMAVGLVLGLHFVSQGNASLKLSAQGTGAATATPAATATASATASPAATASATASATRDSGPRRRGGGQRELRAHRARPTR